MRESYPFERADNWGYFNYRLTGGLLNSKERCQKRATAFGLLLEAQIDPAVGKPSQGKRARDCV
jgi:hypothetical protein